MAIPADNPANVLRFDRHFAGPPSRVFAIWTRPELIAVWFGSSHGFRAQDVAVDLRPGGRWSLRNIKGAAVEHVGGTYHEVIPDQRLLYSYHFEGTDFWSNVSVDLAPDGAGTRMQFLQTGFPDRTAFEEHGKGWGFGLQLMIDGLLLAMRAERSWPATGRLDGVAEDLNAARRRLSPERGQRGLPTDGSD